MIIVVTAVSGLLIGGYFMSDSSLSAILFAVIAGFGCVVYYFIITLPKKPIICRSNKTTVKFISDTSQAARCTVGRLLFCYIATFIAYN